MADTEKKPNKTTSVKAEPITLKGKFTASIGRRKTSIARVRLFKGSEGIMLVNGAPAKEYFQEEDLFSIINQPLKLAGLVKDFNVSIIISGGGKKGQSEAVRHGIARGLLIINPELRSLFKVKGWIMRDARKKERKKPGLKKARRAPQWAKR